MRFFNKAKRIKYLGFDDTRFMVFGILVLGCITFYLFSHSFLNRTFVDLFASWCVSIFFTISNWIIIRMVIILLRKKYPKFKDDIKRIVLLLLAIISTVLLINFLGNELLSVFFNQNYNPVSSSKVVVPVIIISTMTMAIYEAVYYYTRLKTSIRIEEQSKQAIVQAQLEALRNQIQPHFFFNTLNTLRDIIDQNLKEDAKNFVDELSDMYRFLLEAGNANLIPLQDEVQFAKSYINIQSERFGNNLQVIWDIQIASLDAQIVPMSLQLLLENAIKHNVISKTRPLYIKVAIANNQLTVVNTIQLKSTQLNSTKVGLKNIKKRYALICNSPIKINNNGNRFEVSLPLLTPSIKKYADEDIDNRR